MRFSNLIEASDTAIRIPSQLLEIEEGQIALSVIDRRLCNYPRTREPTNAQRFFVSLKENSLRYLSKLILAILFREVTELGT